MILNCQIFVYKNEMAALQKAVQSMGKAFAATEMSGFPARSYTPQICITHLPMTGSHPRPFSHPWC